MAEVIEAPEVSKDAPSASQLVEELLIFGPETETYEFNGLSGTVTVAPMKMGQIRKMLAVAQDIFPQLMMLVDVAKTTGEVDVSALGEIAGDKFFEMIGITINRKASELDEMDPDQFVQLVAKVLVVNMDFFGRTLPQMLTRAKESVRVAAEKSGVGPTLSKNSLGTAISSAISQSTPTPSL